MQTLKIQTRTLLLAFFGLPLGISFPLHCLADPISIIYDLTASGADSSHVDECPRLGPCFQFPIEGHLSLSLNPLIPTLSNLDSNILVPPDAPAPFSSSFWGQLEHFLGEYTSDALSADVSMRFTSPEDAPYSPVELQVELTEGRSLLTLTGGQVGIALYPGEITVLFAVHGQAIPEPTCASLAFLGLGILCCKRSRPLGTQSQEVS